MMLVRPLDGWSNPTQSPDAPGHLGLQASLQDPGPQPNPIRRTQSFGFNPRPLPPVNVVTGVPGFYRITRK